MQCRKNEVFFAMSIFCQNFLLSSKIINASYLHSTLKFTVRSSGVAIRGFGERLWQM